MYFSIFSFSLESKSKYFPHRWSARSVSSRRFVHVTPWPRPRIVAPSLGWWRKSTSLWLQRCSSHVLWLCLFFFLFVFSFDHLISCRFLICCAGWASPQQQELHPHRTLRYLWIWSPAAQQVQVIPNLLTFSAQQIFDAIPRMSLMKKYWIK